MIILNKSEQNPSNIQPSEITPRNLFDNRRNFIKSAGFTLAAGSALMLSNKVHAATLSGGVTEGAGRLIGRANAPATAEKVSVKQGVRQKINGYKKTSYGAGITLCIKFGQQR